VEEHLFSGLHDFAGTPITTKVVDFVLGLLLFWLLVFLIVWVEVFRVFVVFKHHFGDLLELKAVWRLPLKLVFHFSQPGPDYLFRHRQIQKHQRFVKNVSI